MPAAPFIWWLERRLVEIEGDRSLCVSGQLGTPAATILATRLGTTTRTLFRYRKSLDGSNRPTTEFVRQNIDRMLDYAGVDLGDVYPEHRVDIELEPDGYCATCREVVTPIEGLCPWCDSATTDARRRVGAA